MGNESTRKSKLNKIWIAIGGVAGAGIIIPLIIGIIQIIQAGTIAKGDESIAFTQISLQQEQSIVLKQIATLQAFKPDTAPTATSIAEQIKSLEGTVQAIDRAIAELGSGGTIIPITPTYTSTIAVTPTITLTPTTIPSNTSTYTPTPNPSTTTNTINIPLMESGSLSKDWGWSSGSSNSSNYRPSSKGDGITLIAGPQTDFWGSTITAPFLERSVSGDFDVQVQLDFNPTERWQVAGLGIRSSGSDSNDWIAIRRISGGGNQQVIDVAQTRSNSSNSITTISYAKTIVYLKIKRIGELVSFSISENGINWIELKTKYVFSLQTRLNLFLFVYSTTNNGTIADFSNVQFNPLTTSELVVPQGNILLENPNTPGQLDEPFGWFPGGSRSNTYRIENQQLTLISGSYTDLWGNTATAPYIELPVLDNFNIQAKVIFKGSERYQSAGIGLHSEEYPSNWILVRSLSDGSKRQIYVSRNVAGNSEHIITVPNASETIYFRINRSEPLVSLYYSSDGVTWNPLIENFVMGFSGQVRAFIFVFSTSGNGVQASFGDLSITYP